MEREQVTELYDYDTVHKLTNAALDYAKKLNDDEDWVKFRLVVILENALSEIEDIINEWYQDQQENVPDAVQ